MGTNKGETKAVPAWQRAVLGFERWAGFQTKVVWYNVFMLVATHLGTLYACWRYAGGFKWQTAVFTYCTFAFAMFGISGGVHRYWSHRSYKASKPFQILLMIAFAMSGSKTIKSWVRDHRVHHKYSDTDADPHNQNRGFFFAHVGCYLMIKHPEVIKKGQTIDFSDVDNDPIIRFHDKNYSVLKPLVCFIIPIALPCLLWGEAVPRAAAWQYARYLLLLHTNWSLNSITHVFGNKPYDKSIMPTDNKFFTTLLGDEGFHNYHHTFPWDYRTSEFGYNKVSVSTGIIDLFARLGHTWDLKKPSKHLVDTIARNRGDGTRMPAEVPERDNLDSRQTCEEEYKND